MCGFLLFAACGFLLFAACVFLLFSVFVFLLFSLVFFCFSINRKAVLKLMTELRPQLSQLVGHASRRDNVVGQAGKRGLLHYV